MTSLTGYLLSESEPAGGTFRVAVDSQGQSFNARLVHIDGPQGDIGSGPWFVTRPVEGCPAVASAGMTQLTRAGSYGYADAAPSVFGDDGMSMVLWCWPGHGQPSAEMTLFSQLSADGAAGLKIGTTAQGKVSVRLWHGEQEVDLVTETSLRQRAWNAIGLSVDVGRGAADLLLAGKTLAGGTQILESCNAAIGIPRPPAGLVSLGLGADRHDGSQTIDIFEGKIDRPRIWSQPLAVAQLEQALRGGAVAVPPRIEWLFGPASGSQWDPDRVPNSGAAHSSLTMRNRPQVGVTGHCWTGASTDFRVAPEEYSAVRLHSDDLCDVDWEVSVDIQIPDHLASGLYGVELTRGEESDVIPAYVHPTKGVATAADVLFLAPTMTYQAYGNDRQHAHADFGDMTASRDNGPYEDWIEANPQFGSSLYDLHPDGSGWGYSTRRRPLGNVRPGYLSWITGFPRHFSADLAIVAWLEQAGPAFDVLTDHDLHRGGVTVLDQYKVVVTGSHPEYFSAEMLDALGDYVQRGGRVMYLGGNGFYWATGVADDDAIEVRRGHAGTRSWESLPGEDVLMTTAEPGGLWRHRGRAPNALVGVGFAAQGWTGGVPYVIAEDIPDDLRQLVFGDLPAGAIIGDFGSLGGAAGDEVDRFDVGRGSPKNTVVLASSSRFNDGYQPAVEDHPTLTPGVGGGSNSEVRADLSYVKFPDAGAVFSVGSINWFSCLPVNRFDNDIAAVSTNVLGAFVAGLM